MARELELISIKYLIPNSIDTRDLQKILYYLNMFFLFSALLILF